MLRIVLVSYVFFSSKEEEKRLAQAVDKGVNCGWFALARPEEGTKAGNQRPFDFPSAMTAGGKRKKGDAGPCCRVLRGLIRGYVLMILPQVHLRKPCYDFYFL